MNDQYPINKYRLLVGIIFFAVFMSCIHGCGILHSVDVIKRDDGAETVKVYAFGCKNYLPEISVNKNDFAVWVYCPNEKEETIRLWTAGPTGNEKVFYDHDFKKYPVNIPTSFRSSVKINMLKCGQSKMGSTLYCGEFTDAGYKFKLWKDTKSIFVNLDSPYNYLEYMVGGFALQKQIKLTFKPDVDGTSFTDKEISAFFEKAQSVGLELGYEILLIDQKLGKISFIKKSAENNASLKVEVLIMQFSKWAYVYITVLGNSQSVVDSALVEFKKRYASKFQ